MGSICSLSRSAGGDVARARTVHAMPTSPKILLEQIWKHPANRRRRVRALSAAVGWQAYKHLSDKPRDLKVYGGMCFRAHPTSTQPGRFLYFGGYPDYEEMTFMCRFLRPGDGFIDGGANEGMFALLAAKLVGPTGDVQAFEPVPEYIQRLRHNVEANGLSQVNVHGDAIGDAPGDVSFVVRGTGSRIQTPTDRGAVITTRVVTLDDALPARSWAMAKLDLEGAEHLALKGAQHLIRIDPPPVWMLEVADRFLHRFDSSEAELRQWLGDYGYDLVLYRPESNTFERAPDPIWPLIDLMALHRDRADEVKARLSEGQARRIAG